MYASHYALQVSELLGSGIHGIVCVLESNTDPGRRALKVHRDSDAYQREKIVYLRLRANRVDRILGLNVPVLLRFDDAFMAIEMTIVTPPFVLDFAGAYLDPPRNTRIRSGPIGRPKSGNSLVRFGTMCRRF